LNTSKKADNILEENGRISRKQAWTIKGCNRLNAQQGRSARLQVFPEPDLVPFVSAKRIKAVKDALPDCQAKKKRLSGIP